MSVLHIYAEQCEADESPVNHKPNLSNGTRTTKISRSSNGEPTLSIRDNEEGNISRYAYKGQRSSQKNSYVLIFDPDTQSCTLEPVKSAYNFNLTSTPWETSKEKLARQYEQLGAREETSQGITDADPNGEPDVDNPFDFRHFLNLNARVSPSPSPALKPASTTHTPSLTSSHPSASATKPQARPASKVDPLRQVPRKPKPATAQAKPQSNETPTVRLDRRASTRPNDAAGDKKSSKPAARPAPKSTAVKSDYYVHSSDDEDSPPLPQTSQTSREEKKIDAEESGGLEIDWGNERPKPRKPPPSRSLDLPDLGGDGPISLHSAANSPAGRMAIPRKQQKKRQEYEADVIDFGTSDAYVSDDSPPGEQTQEQDEDTQMHDAGESDGDDDVEPMELGSPAHHQPPQPQHNVTHEPLPDLPPEDEVDYDDDDLEAQMLAAMEDEEDEAPPAVADDESDVSEAE